VLSWEVLTEYGTLEVGEPINLEPQPSPFFFCCITLATVPRRPLSLELSDTHVYEPQTGMSLKQEYEPESRIIGMIFKVANTS